jgi:hypothetical protein
MMLPIRGRRKQNSSILVKTQEKKAQESLGKTLIHGNDRYILPWKMMEPKGTCSGKSE